MLRDTLEWIHHQRRLMDNYYSNGIHWPSMRNVVGYFIKFDRYCLRSIDSQINPTSTHLFLPCVYIIYLNLNLYINRKLCLNIVDIYTRWSKFKFVCLYIYVLFLIFKLILGYSKVLVYIISSQNAPHLTFLKINMLHIYAEVICNSEKNLSLIWSWKGPDLWGLRSKQNEGRIPSNR